MNYNDLKDYDTRKQLLEDLKILNKFEQEEIYRILKLSNSIFTENSNGIFFDVSRLHDSVFEQIVVFINFCKQNRENFQTREEEEKRAHEIVNNTES
jgi:hypothetical protein